MKKESRWISFTGVGALALIMVAGCTGADQTGDGKTADSPEAAKMQSGVDKAQEGAKDAAGAAGDAAAKGGQTVVNAASNAGNAAANAAVKTGEAVSNAASTAGQATVNAANKAISSTKNLDDAAKITPLVKTAIGANAALKGSNINVTTTDKDVSLDGTVKTQAQKALAGNIAKANAAGYAIKNNLKVG